MDDASLARRRPPPPREIDAVRGLVVEVLGDGFAGEVVRCDARQVTLRDRRGRERHFSLQPGGFVLDERPVTLRPPPVVTGPPAVRTTASGSIAVPGTPARTARASRILVEGIHDAALLETVWGADLRVEGVVVEPVHGIDDLPAVVDAFAPGPQRRLGILLDHLVAGSKESRVAAAVTGPDVLVTGHPFVDVWAAVRPAVLGIPAWPEVPAGEDWKSGTAHRLGYHDATDLWRALAQAVTSWRDLDRSFIRAVERLIDFVC